MIGLGTIVNSAAIIAGGTIGVLARSGLPERYRETVMQALGLAVVIIGLSGCLQGIFLINSTATPDRRFIMLMIFSLVTGGLLGEFMNIEQRLESAGRWVQSRIGNAGGNFSEGFVSASLLYCVGAMAIVGSIEDGLTGNTSTLFAKAVLDGVSAVILGAAMGIGVVFSAVPVFLYQGTITVLAGLIKPWLTDTVILQTSMVGSVLIMAIGVNLLGIKNIKAGNLLPAVFVPLTWYVIESFIR